MAAPDVVHHGATDGTPACTVADSACFLTAWLEERTPATAPARLKLFTERPGARDAAVRALGEAVADHLYGAELLAKCGYAQAAAKVRSVLPRGKKIRSGDLGEVVATEYIVRRTEYRVPVKRLRYKDDREMPMRGDDVIGLAPSVVTAPAALPEMPPEVATASPANPTLAPEASRAGLAGARRGRTRVLKAEVKSYAALTSRVVGNACAQLDANHGRPKPSTLGFLAHKLRMAGHDDDAELIEHLQEQPVRVEDLAHLVFVLSGNNPITALTAHAAPAGRPITRHLVGVRVAEHGRFVATVFDTLAKPPEAEEAAQGAPQTADAAPTRSTDATVD